MVSSMTLTAPQPEQAGFYWYRYDDLSSHRYFKVLVEVIQMQPQTTQIGGKFLVWWLNRLVPLEQVPAGRWRGPIRDLR
jgi:hypothetical protein